MSVAVNESSVGHMRGTEVMAFRRRHKLSQKDFAELLGVTLGGVKKWEDDKRGFSEPLWRLLQMFDKYPHLMREF